MALSVAKVTVIGRTFIAAADHDYMTARWAHSNASTGVFLWHFQQLVEKYLKAIALLNEAYKYVGKSHSIKSLLEYFLEQYPYLAKSEISAERHLFGKEKETFSWTLKDILSQVEVVAADVRYNLLDRRQSGEQLKILDFVVFKLRQALAQNTHIKSQNHQLNSSFNEQDFCLYPRSWIVGNTLPLEKKVTNGFALLYRFGLFPPKDAWFFSENSHFGLGTTHLNRFSGYSVEGDPVAAIMTAEMRMAGSKEEFEEAVKHDKIGLEWALEFLPMSNRQKKYLEEYFRRVENIKRDGSWD